MSRYRRLKIEGGVFFFTLTLADRGTDLLVRDIERLRRAYVDMQKLPFETVATLILPDHTRPGYFSHEHSDLLFEPI